MSQSIKDATALCKTIMRNGYDAYIINAPLQKKTLTRDGEKEVDISTDLNLDGLIKMFPKTQQINDPEVTAILREGDTIFFFYPINVSEGAYTEACISKYTTRMLKKLEAAGELPLSLACPYIPKAQDANDGFCDFCEGVIRLEGLPDETLKINYLRAIRAMRFAANYNLPIETNTWLAIIRSAQRVLDYVPASDIMDEWRKVEAETMWKFVDLLFQSMILHGLIPELTSLSRVKHVKNPEEGEETIFEHTLKTMRFYPEELPFDWYGTLACLFHDIGKLYTGEMIDGRITFYHHHYVGANVTRKILKRLSFDPQDIDLVCHLVRHHMRFHFMLTDKGIRRFKALNEYPRLIEMARADIKARNGNYTEFNHNVKMLERADIHEDMIEPLLNGHEIMIHTQVKPGPSVGLIRDALLQAQIAGDVTSVAEAQDFAKRYALREKLQ